MKALLVLLPALLSALPAAALGATPDDPTKKSPAELERGIADAHPANYYVLAQKLFESGKRDEAIFWFYAGQLRYRFHLAAHPDLEPSGDPALFSSLSEVLGRPLNEYAFGDLKGLRGTIQRVLDWDERTANGFTSKTNFASAWKDTRAGLEKLRDDLRANAEEIRKQRKANGLANRTTD